jgi:predicted GNAT family N-acyltransferase
MHEIRLIRYDSDAYREMVVLREEILRRPLGLHFTAAYLAQEIDDVLVGCYGTGPGDTALMGCCILSPVDEELVQLRQMAVREEMQRGGIGRELMEFAERKAAELGFLTLMMHARKVAVPFYERLGYRAVGDEFLEVGIPHMEMTKDLR